MSKPNSRLLGRHQLLRYVIHSPWATLLDVRVMSVMVEEWRSYKGYVSISVRQLEKAIGLKGHLTDIRRSISKLVAHQVILITHKGAGKRASEYTLNFELLEGAESAPSTTSNVAEDQILEGAESASYEGAESASSTASRGGGISPQPPISSRLNREEERGSANARPPQGGAPDGAPLKEESTGTALVVQSPALVPTTAPDGFAALQAIWATCPHPDDMAEARRLFTTAAAEVGPNVILAAASAYVTSADSPRFVSRLTKWLLSRGWELPLAPHRNNASSQVRRGGNLAVMRWRTCN